MMVCEKCGSKEIRAIYRRYLEEEANTGKETSQSLWDLDYFFCVDCDEEVDVVGKKD